MDLLENTKIRVTTETREEIDKLLCDLLEIDTEDFAARNEDSNIIHSYYISKDTYSYHIGWNNKPKTRGVTTSEDYFNSCVEREITLEYLQELYNHKYRNEEINESKRYMVFVDNKRGPSVIHNTLESAETEAKRLAEKEIGKTVSICEIVKQYKSSIIVDEL